MINYEDGIETVKTNSVLYSQPDAVRKLAIMMLVNAAEGNVDMVCDMPEEYEGKDDIEDVFAPLADQALDMLEDHIADLRRSLESFLRSAKVTAKVRRLDYTKEGKLSDITVDLDVK
jgi:hypothetical protein